MTARTPGQRSQAVAHQSKPAWWNGLTDPQRLHLMRNQSALADAAFLAGVTAGLHAVPDDLGTSRDTRPQAAGAEGTRMTEYAFDATLSTGLRVSAASEGDARQKLERLLDAIDVDLGAELEGEGVSRVTEASIGNVRLLFEVDGRAV